jgi:hypothetical protein
MTLEKISAALVLTVRLVLVSGEGTAKRKVTKLTVKNMGTLPHLETVSTMEKIGSND